MNPLLILFGSNGTVREHAKWSLISLLLYNVLVAVFLVPFMVILGENSSVSGVGGWLGLAAGLIAVVFYVQFLVLIAVNLGFSLAGRRPYRGVCVRLYAVIWQRG